MGTWKSKNRHKYLLQYHIIFVCKYRKKLLVSRQISDDIKQFSYEICQRHSVIIRYMETDKGHIHYMIETEPTMSISKIVNLMKSYTTYHIWKRYPQYLRKQFWKEHTFWTDGYFACSVGNVSEEMLKRYIGNSSQKISTHLLIMEVDFCPVLCILEVPVLQAFRGISHFVWYCKAVSDLS